MAEPPLPDRGSAIFFDFDGTLVDLAPRPDDVRVGSAVPDLLARLAALLGGAVGVVSGRPVAQIDDHLQPLRLPVAGVHGAERRGTDGFLRRIAVPDLAPARDLAEALVSRHPSLLLEVKPGALAVHYRQAELLEDEVLSTMIVAQSRVDGMAVMRGKKVVELRPRRAGKGEAVRAFLAEWPFRHRRPWFFGDDVTDESAFEAVLALGGVAVKVGEGETLATCRLGRPLDVHGWIENSIGALSGQESLASRPDR